MKWLKYYIGSDNHLLLGEWREQDFEGLWKCGEAGGWIYYFIFTLYPIIPVYIFGDPVTKMDKLKSSKLGLYPS